MKNNAADQSHAKVTTHETQSTSARASEISRRQFLTAAAKGLGAAALLSSGLPKGWIGGAYADEGPETSNIKFGMIALTDCSPIVIAHEKGFFRK
jgi:nitrate/nitrite transport system substrate-binding protein